MKLSLFLALVFCGGFAFAEGESIISGMNVCVNHSGSSAEALDCAKRGYKNADNLLNYHYQIAMKSLISQNDWKGRTFLIRNQNEWLNNTRNTGCQANPDTGRTFDGRPLDIDAYKCLASVTVDKVNDLIQTFEVE